mmetsp:Transcript_96792/g.177421  ORF Transcript_96792/g.177421 Transcript_96792/m.177421 type:complete len:387 (+) Transcript_96792:73-1233(+)
MFALWISQMVIKMAISAATIWWQLIWSPATYGVKLLRSFHCFAAWVLSSLRSFYCFANSIFSSSVEHQARCSRSPSSHRSRCSPRCSPRYLPRCSPKHLTPTRPDSGIADATASAPCPEIIAQLQPAQHAPRPKPMLPLAALGNSTALLADHSQKRPKPMLPIPDLRTPAARLADPSHERPKPMLPMAALRTSTPMLPAANFTEAVSKTPPQSLPESFNSNVVNKTTRVAFADSAEWIYFDKSVSNLSLATSTLSGSSALSASGHSTSTLSVGSALSSGEDADAAGTQTPRRSRSSLPEIDSLSSSDALDAKTPRMKGTLFRAFSGSDVMSSLGEDSGGDSFCCTEEASSDLEEDMPHTSEALDAKTPRVHRSVSPTFDSVLSDEL